MDSLDTQLARARAEAEHAPGDPRAREAWARVAARCGRLEEALEVLRLRIPCGDLAAVRAYLALVRRHEERLGDPCLQVPAARVTCLSPDGTRLLLAGGRGAVRLLDVATATVLQRGELPHAWESGDLDEEGRPVLGAVEDDGRIVVCRLEATGEWSRWSLDPTEDGPEVSLHLGGGGRRLVVLGPTVQATARPAPGTAEERGTMVPLGLEQPLLLRGERHLSPSGRWLQGSTRPSRLGDVARHVLLDLDRGQHRSFPCSPAAWVHHTWSPDERCLVLVWDATDFFDPISDPEQVPTPPITPGVLMVSLPELEERRTELAQETDDRDRLERLDWVDPATLAIGRYRLDVAAGQGRFLGEYLPPTRSLRFLWAIRLANGLLHWAIHRLNPGNRHPAEPGISLDPALAPLGHACVITKVGFLPDGRLLTRDQAGVRLIWSPGDGGVEVAGAEVPDPPEATRIPEELPGLPAHPIPHAADPSGRGYWVAQGCSLCFHPGAGREAPTTEQEGP